MKKAKIMLTAIAVLGAAGGVLAFKAKTFNGRDLYTSVGDQCIKSILVDAGDIYIVGTLVNPDHNIEIGATTNTVVTCTFDVQTQGE